MEESSRIRVVVVDHTAFGRAALPPLIEVDPSLEVASLARDVEEGKRAILEQDPDVVVLALHSELEAGLGLLEWVVSQSLRPVIGLLPVDPDPDTQLRVLEAGAAYIIPWSLNHTPARLMAFQSLLASKLKAFGVARVPIPDLTAVEPDYPSLSLESELADDSIQEISSERLVPDITNLEDTEELLEEALEPLELEAARGRVPRSPLQRLGTGGLVYPKRETGARDPDRRAEVAVLGGGAGSPALFRRIVAQLPEELNLAILGVLRLPGELLPHYAERLQQVSRLPVSVAQEGDPVRPGHILLAPPRRNMGMVRTGRIPKALIRLMPPGTGISATPSMDVSLRASATIYGTGSVGIVLGGLSKDGASGLLAVRNNNGLTHMIDYKYAVAYNTNRLCYESGLIDEVSSPEGVVELLKRLGQRY